jgi:hypothetical protein
MNWLLSNGTEEFRDEERQHALSGDEASDSDEASDVQMVECPCCRAIFPAFEGSHE